MDERMICSETELSLALRQLAEKIIIVPSKAKKLSRNADSTNGGTASDTTFDHYYVDMVNDTLDEIRAGRTAYIFNQRQIADVLCFEPKATFKYRDGAIAVRLPA